MTPNYFYVACDGGDKCNAEYRHYFRLYKNTDKGPILIEQSVSDVPTWEVKYNATFNPVNPYPDLD
jgi:hypothetical protein